jgi:ketosteroid isomerase-like protein
MSASSQGTDPASFIQHDFDGAWNRHDMDTIMQFFTDDAVVNLAPPPPGAPPTFRGKEEIRSFVQTFLPGFHVESRNLQVKGDTVTWHWTVSADAFRQLGADPAEGTSEAVVQGGKIQSFAVIISPETLAKMQTALPPGGTSGSPG